MNSQHDPGSHLFLVRFWSGGAHEVTNEQEAEEGNDAHGHKEWIGRVQHVLTGEARTFHDWTTLIDLLLEMAETDGIEAQAPRGKTKEAI